MRRPRWVPAAVTAALLVTVGTGLTGCAAAELREKAAAHATAAAAAWNDSLVQQRWLAAVVAESPLVEPPVETANGVLERLRQGSVELSPDIGDERQNGVVDYASASDQTVTTMGAASTLHTVTTAVPGPCPDTGSCDAVKVTRAAATTVTAQTARGTASVPAWSFEVDGLAAPLVLPAVPVTSAADIAPGRSVSSWAWLLDRDGSTLRVSLVMPFCGGSHYERHLLETDAAIVVWATAKPNDNECTSAVRAEETFTLRAPVGDRPVIDSVGGLLLPAPRMRG